MNMNVYATKDRPRGVSTARAIWVASCTGEKCVRPCMTCSRGWDSVTTIPAAYGLLSQPVRHHRQSVE